MDETITLSKIESYLRCPHSYYLDEKLKEVYLPITGFDAKRDWLKQSFKKLVPQAAAMTAKGLKGAELAAVLKYDPVKFANTRQGEWVRRFFDKGEKYCERDIAWLYPEQGWKEGQKINNACRAYYNHLLKEGVPVGDFTEKDIEFYFGGRKWTVRPGVVRYGDIAEEIRTTEITKKKVDKDWTIAPKLYAIYTPAKDPFPEGLWYRRVSLNGGNYHQPNTIIPMYAALNVVENVEKRIANGEFPPNHKNCETCRYNVLTAYNKPACKERKRKLRIMKPISQLIR